MSKEHCVWALLMPWFPLYFIHKREKNIYERREVVQHTAKWIFKCRSHAALGQGQILQCVFTQTDLANSRTFAVSNPGNMNPSMHGMDNCDIQTDLHRPPYLFYQLYTVFYSTVHSKAGNLISIAFGVEKRLCFGSICTRWMRHKWGKVWNPPEKVTLWYSVSAANPPQDSLKPLKSPVLFISLCRIWTSRTINKNIN